MKTLADFKRAMKQKPNVHTYFHPTNIDMGIAPVKTVAATYFTVMRQNGESYMDWPKARDCEFDGNKVTIYDEGEKLLTYTIIV